MVKPNRFLGSFEREGSIVASLWRASEARAAPDARNVLKHVRDDVYSSFEDLDGVWSSCPSLRRTKNREEASSMVVTLNELKYPNNNVWVLFRRTLHTDVR